MKCLSDKLVFVCSEVYCFPQSCTWIYEWLIFTAWIIFFMWYDLCIECMRWDMLTQLLVGMSNSSLLKIWSWAYVVKANYG